MKFFVIALGGMVALASMQAVATDDYNRTIARFGVQFNNGFIVFKEPLSASCGSVGIGSLDTSQTKAMYASILTAKATDGVIYHIGYTVNGDGTCTATSMELQ